MIKKICTFWLVVVMMLYSINTFALSRPEDISFSDFSGIVSDGIKNYVKSKNNLLFDFTEAKIVFVTDDSINAATANDYAKSIYSSWNMGNLGRGNSILIVMSEKSQDYGFYQGRAIKRMLTDEIIYEMISKDFEPYFSKGNYDAAVMNLYNSLGRWYEENYSGLKLNLADDYTDYMTNTKTADIDKNPNAVWMWAGAGVVIFMIIIFFNIKRNIDFKARQTQRKIKRKRNKADIDKIVNS